MEGLIEIITNVCKEGLLVIGITEIIFSLLIFISVAIMRAFFVGRVLKWLENLLLRLIRKSMMFSCNH